MQRPGFSTGSRLGLLEWFHKRWLRSILGIKFQDYVSNEELLKTASLPSIESILPPVQLRWAGHVTRMEEARMPKAVFFGEFREGKRDRCAPRKRYKDQLKKQFAQRESSIRHGSKKASNQNSWCSSVRKASCGFEAEA